MKELIIKATGELRAGRAIEEHRSAFLFARDEYNKGTAKCCLDLSGVEFMDSVGFRLIFDFLPVFYRVIPPSNKDVIDNYNAWVEGKKGLTKEVPA